MDEHLAGCPTCHEVFAETLRFALDEEAEGAFPRTSPTVIPFVRRPAFRLAAVLAVAAGVFLAFQQIWRARSERVQPSLVAELAQAIGTTRFVEPRLTGGFQHGRLVILRSGDRPQGLDAHTPSVIAAVARIRERAEDDTSPEALGALAVTHLVSGDVGKAVKALESATAQDPKNPRLQSDLAAVYLVRASRLDEPADIPKALEAAETAITLEGAPPEAWFNRALALEQLHLADSARKAWYDYLERDSTSAWADEARKRLEDLPPAQQSTIEEHRARARKALAEGPAALSALADESPSILADFFLAELLPAWSDAHLTGHPTATVLRTQAEQVGEAVFRTTGDALPRDAALALSQPPSGPSRDPPRLQAQGYKALHEAQRLHDLGQSACHAFRESRLLLDQGASPYSAWARERIVVACPNMAQTRQGLAELDRLEALAAQRGYRRLMGRVHWMQALVPLSSAGFSRTLERYRLAAEDFRALRDGANEANVRARLAYALREAGEHRLAWRERISGLALLDEIRQPEQRYVQLLGVAVACADQHLLRAALNVTETWVATSRQGMPAMYLVTALLWRVLILDGLSLEDRAAADLAEARRAVQAVDIAAVAEDLTAQADAAEGRILGAREPEPAAAALTRALRYFERTTPVRVPGLRLLLGRAHAALGRDDAAEAELLEGLRLLESQREPLGGNTRLQTSFFDQGLSLFEAMVAFHLDRRNDPTRALSFVERGRARSLLDSLHGPSTATRAGVEAGATPKSRPLEPEALQRELPTGTALVYYQCQADRLLSWVLTREGIHFVTQALAQDDLRRHVATYSAALEGRASPAVVQRLGGSLFDRLIRPLRPYLRGQRALILVPDEALQPVAFAGLWDGQVGRFLIEDHLIGVAPSGSVFARASKAASAASLKGDRKLLSVGNPRLDRKRWAGLPDLPQAQAEATEITSLYTRATLLTGAEATRGRFLEGARTSGVVHFAGHALAGDAAASPRLLFAPDASSGDTGALDLLQLDRTALRQTRLVVLAACRTAAGTVSRSEGMLSLARPILAAGVPNVVASMWDADDAVSRRFFLAFHRSLLAEGEPLLALQRAQIAFLRHRDPVLAHPASWAGFLAIGGMDSRKLLRAPSQRTSQPL